ncbi:hypothetical protein ACIGB8_24305 [Promicromonospora sukumoe]|uniref:hypothetical protein n=1 Tax=Promicromonospora sukumoe TaxID=88382 RepID=UPI0037CA0079
MGATSALRGGAELGRVLRDTPDDLRVALTAWESRLRSSILRHQRIARLKQQMFVPSSRWTEAVRSFVLRLRGAARRRRVARELSATPAGSGPAW